MDWFKEMCTSKEHDLDYDFHIESLTLNKPFIYLAISEYDVLRDEGMEFKEQLESVKAHVKCRVLETMPHNFILMAGKIKGAKKAIETICLDLKEMI
jgi:acetyl esterase/lipase